MHWISDKPSGPDTIAAFADRLSTYKFAKGSVQFPLDQPLPKPLILEMVRHRLSRLRG